MRHHGEIPNHGLAVNIFPEHQGDLPLRAAELVVLEQLAQRHGHAGIVGDLNAHRVLARNGCENIYALCLGSAGNVGFELGNPAHPQSHAGVNLVAGNGRSARDVAGGHIHSEGLQRFDDIGLLRDELTGVVLKRSLICVVFEQVETGKFVVFKPLRTERAVLLGLLALKRLGARGQGGRDALAGIDDLRLGELPQWQLRLALLVLFVFALLFLFVLPLFLFLGLEHRLTARIFFPACILLGSATMLRRPRLGSRTRRRALNPGLPELPNFLLRPVVELLHKLDRMDAEQGKETHEVNHPEDNRRAQGVEQTLEDHDPE